MTHLRNSPGVSRNQTPGVWFSRQMTWPAGQGGGCVVLQADDLTSRPRWWVCGSPGRWLDQQAKEVVVGVWFSRQMTWPAGQGGGGGCVVHQADALTSRPRGWWMCGSPGRWLDQQAKEVVVLHKYTPLCWYWPLQCGGATQIPLCWYWPLQCGGATQIHTIVLVLTNPMWWYYTNTHHCVGTDHSNVVVLHKYTPLCWYWPLPCGGATQIHTIVLVLTTPVLSFCSHYSHLAKMLTPAVKHKHWKDTYNDSLQRNICTQTLQRHIQWLTSEPHLYTNTGKTHTMTHFSSTSVHKHCKDTYNDSLQQHICTQTLERHIQWLTSEPHLYTNTAKTHTMTHFRATSVHKHCKDTYNDSLQQHICTQTLQRHIQWLTSEAHLYTNTAKTHTMTHFSSTSVHKHCKDTYNDSLQRNICTQFYAVTCLDGKVEWDRMVAMLLEKKTLSLVFCNVLFTSILQHHWIKCIQLCLLKVKLQISLQVKKEAPSF